MPLPHPCTQLTESPAGKLYFPPESMSTSTSASPWPPRAGRVEKSWGWYRPSCCSFSGFWVRVAEKSSFCSGIWGQQVLKGGQTLGEQPGPGPTLLTLRDQPRSSTQGRAARDQVPGSGHNLGLPSLEQSNRIPGALLVEGCSHHPREPGLVHAVYHPVGLVDDLQNTEPSLVGEAASAPNPGLRWGGQPTRKRRCWRLNPRVWSMWSTRRPGVATTMSARQRKPSALHTGKPTDPQRREPLGLGRPPGCAPPVPASPEPMPTRTYVFWTRLSCSLASAFCPVTRATRRRVASV